MTVGSVHSSDDGNSGVNMFLAWDTDSAKH